MKGVHPMETLRFSDFLDSYIQTMPDSMQDGIPTMQQRSAKRHIFQSCCNF